MSLKEALIKSVENAPDGIACITVSELSIMLSRLLNTVCEKDRTLIVSNRGEDVAVIFPYEQYVERVIGVKKNRGGE